MRNSTILVRKVSGLRASTRYRVEIVDAAPVPLLLSTLSFRTTSPTVFRFGHTSCSDDEAWSSAGPTVARFHSTVAPLDLFLFNGDSTYARGASFDSANPNAPFGTYARDAFDTSTDDGRGRDPDWCDLPHIMRRQLFSRDSVTHKAIYSNMPVLGNIDDHDFSPNNYFGVESAGLNAAAMRTAASFDRVTGSRAFKAFWPSQLYVEVEGNAGIDSISIGASPLADFFITDTRFTANDRSLVRFEAGTFARISAWCAASSSKPALVIAIASTMTRGDAAIETSAQSQLAQFISALNSTACRSKAIVILSGDVHYSAMHARVFGMPHVFEFTSSGLSRYQPDARVVSCPGPDGKTTRLYTAQHQNNFGVVEITLNAQGGAVVRATAFNAAGQVIANTLWDPSTSATVRASISASVCSVLPPQAGVDFSLAAAAPIPARAAFLGFNVSAVPNGVTMVPVGAGMRPVFVMGDQTCLIGLNNVSHTYAQLEGTTWFPKGMKLEGIGADLPIEAWATVPMRTRVEVNDGAIGAWALLQFQNGLLTAIDASDGTLLFSCAYFRCFPFWPAHWSTVDAAVFANLGAATVDAEDENGRLFVFRGAEFIVYNVARCFGRGDAAACKVSATTRRFGFEFATPVTLFARACPIAAGVRSIATCFGTTGFPSAQITANGGVDGVTFTFANMFNSRALLDIGGSGEGQFDFFIGTNIHRVPFTDAAGLGTWAAPQARSTSLYSPCFVTLPPAPTTSTTTTTTTTTTTMTTTTAATGRTPTTSVPTTSSVPTTMPTITGPSGSTETIADSNSVTMTVTELSPVSVPSLTILVVDPSDSVALLPPLLLVLAAMVLNV